MTLGIDLGRTMAARALVREIMQARRAGLLDDASLTLVFQILNTATMDLDHAFPFLEVFLHELGDAAAEARRKEPR